MAHYPFYCHKKGCAFFCDTKIEKFANKQHFTDMLSKESLPLVVNSNVSNLRFSLFQN